MIEQMTTTGASTEAQDLVERAKALLWRDVLQWEDYYKSRQYLSMKRGT